MIFRLGFARVITASVVMTEVPTISGMVRPGSLKRKLSANIVFMDTFVRDLVRAGISSLVF